MAGMMDSILHTAGCAAYFCLVYIHFDHQRQEAFRVMKDEIADRLTMLSYTLLGVSKAFAVSGLH